MKLWSSSFEPGQRIPEEFAFCRIDDRHHVALASNCNPELRWSDLPAGTQSLVLLCVDPDVPSVGDDVNQEGKRVPADLPRVDFFHWVMVDIRPDIDGIDAGSCSSGITPRGKKDPPGPEGSRQGQQDYTGWFANDPDMSGVYLGYDGPAPPWNDERLHHYHFQLFALDVPRLDVEGHFTGADVRQAVEGHVLGTAEVTGTYSLNPAVR